MSSIFKNFNDEDVYSTRTLLHEAIPITGSIVSGTYSDNNIKNFSHGYFQQVYDYPHASSSANHIFDITMGISSQSALSATTTTANEVDKKINVYNQLAQVLVGHDTTGSILPFDADGDIAGGGTKYREVFFLTFTRLLYKDEVKKGSFQLILGTGTFDAPSNFRKTITDTSGSNDFRVNSPVGEYGILYDGNGTLCGLLYYQAGIVVLDFRVFDNLSTFATGGGIGTRNVLEQVASGSISGTADFIRRRIYDCSFNNTTELHSRIYICRANHNEFNYSTNPTYTSGSKINVKNTKTDAPVAYLTEIGLYSSDNELMAVSKPSEALKKSVDSPLSLRVRLDF